MAIRKLILTLALAALSLPSFAFANHEHRATVMTRNGDRVAGLLEDVENGIVYIRVSTHDQRRLPIGQVALIDFVGGATGLPDTELSVARHPDHLVLMRDGSSWTGSFVDIRGGEATAFPGEPHVLYFRTGGEERRVGLDHVARIYLGNFPVNMTMMPSVEMPRTLASTGVRVPGHARWVATPLFVRAGDLVVFNATGNIQLSDDPGDVAHAAGSLRQRYARRSPIPENFAGALIARIGNSAPFAIGDVSTPIEMPATGQVFLGVNDDELSDNRGEFTVTLRRETNE